MKKIIATVLAMVMALALCTVAFATETYPKTETTVAKVDAVTATTTNKGHDTYWKATTTTQENESAEKVVDSIKYYADKDCDKEYNEAISAMLTAGGYYKINLVKYAAAADATCTDAGYAVDIWNDANGNYYAKASDVAAANKAGAGLSTTGTEVYIGSSMNDFDKYLTIGNTEAVAKLYGKTAATHVLYKTSETFGENKTTVYACALCGAKFVTKAYAGSTDGATAAEVAKLDKVTYTKDVGFVNYVLNAKGILTNKAADSDTYYKIAAGTTPVTPSTTKPSPKTFDAGIAMYVGMALTSVAGSALVIGKKKEF